jgi:N-methylhydantoinase B
MNRIALTLLQEQLEGIAQEMGSALARAAFSPNIRVRRDFSCALFSEHGELLAQAAHIPVHLGSMPAHVRRLLETRKIAPGELYLGNDPYDGGTHLPDLTLLRPIFTPCGQSCLGIAAVRAHHADVGGPNPGSMSSQRDIYGEGLRLPLIRVAENEVWNDDLRAVLLANMRSPSDREGDLLAQQAACQVGEQGLARVFAGWAKGSSRRWRLGQQMLLEASQSLVRHGLASALPANRTARFDDLLECAGQTLPVCVRVGLTAEGCLRADFEGTAPAVAASFNAPLPVTQAALAYVVSCLMDEPVAINEGLLRCLEVQAPEGCLVHARHPAAVAAGNVETSQRIVDVLLGALQQLIPQRIPAASAGTMNNLSFGFGQKVHYETSGGGCGGHPSGPGRSALQVHMTNTRSTPSEVLEIEFPVRVVSHHLRHGSGGSGRHRGGDGTVKTLEFLQPATLTLMATRRTTAPYGLEGGEDGLPGRQATRDSTEQDWLEQPGSFTVALPAGSSFVLETPGGGGWGPADSSTL